LKLLRPTGVVLALLCLMYFITYLDRTNVSTAAAGFGRDFHLNSTRIGLVFSAFAYPYLIFQVIGGWVSDRFGTRPTLIVCGLIWAAATALSGLATGLVSLLAARLLLGLGEGATFPASTAAMARWVPKARRGFAQGITHAAARIGNASAPIVIVAVMAAKGWRMAFFACAALSFAWVLLWMLTFTERPQDHPRITAEELSVLPPPNVARPLVPWARLARRMAAVVIVYFCYGWNLWLFLTWIPQYFLQLLRSQSVQVRAVRLQRFSRRCGGRHAGRAGDRPHSQNHRQPRQSAQHHGRDLHGAERPLIAAADVHPRPDRVGHLSVGRFLLRRNGDRADVGGADGHRPGIVRHRQRHDEYRLGACRHYQPGRGRSHH